MKISVLKETSSNELRVPLTPLAVGMILKKGHEIFITSNAGARSGFSNEEYQKFGATIVRDNIEAIRISKIILKVGDLIQDEINELREYHYFLSFLHLVNKPYYATQLAKSKCTAIGFESIQDKSGKYPILSPMSKMAGRLAVGLAMRLLSDVKVGKGVLLGSLPTTGRAKVIVLGAGNAGMEVAKICSDLGCRVKVFDINLNKLDHLADQKTNIEAFYPYPQFIEEHLLDADVVFGCLHSKLQQTGILVFEETVKKMQKGSVIIDLSANRGGCIETSKPQDNQSGMYIQHGILHHSPRNILGTIPKSASNILSTTLLPVALKLATFGHKKERGIFEAIQISNGEIVNNYDIEFSNIDDNMDYDSPFDMLSEEVGLGWREVDEINTKIDAIRDEDNLLEFLEIGDINAN